MDSLKSSVKKTKRGFWLFSEASYLVPASPPVPAPPVAMVFNFRQGDFQMLTLERFHISESVGGNNNPGGTPAQGPYQIILPKSYISNYNPTRSQPALDMTFQVGPMATPYYKDLDLKVTLDANNNISFNIIPNLLYIPNNVGDLNVWDMVCYFTTEGTVFDNY